MAKYTFTQITEKEYAKLIEKASYATFYNSIERVSFIQKRNRKTGMFKISNENSTVGLLTYQVIPAHSGTFVYFQHSPLFIDTQVAEDLEFWKEFKQFATEIGNKEQAVYVRLTPRIPVSNEIVKDVLSEGYKRAPVQELDACVTRTIAIDQFEVKNLRTDIFDLLQLANKKELTVSITNKSESVEDFAAIYRTLAAKKLLDYVPVDYLRDELKTYAEAKMLLVAKVLDKNDALFASAAIVIDGETAWYYWNAPTDQGRECGADVLMLVETIKELAKQKVRVLDLWGGSVSKEIADKGLPHPWSKLDRFKQGFGAKLVEYLPALDIPIKAPLYLAAVFYQRALMTKRGYPYLPLSVAAAMEKK